MTAALTAAAAAHIAVPPPDADRWVLWTKTASFSIQCQPLAARGGNDIMWPATIRGISTTKIALELERRFEPQTSLSLSLPEPGLESTCSVFVKIIQVEPLTEGHWLLDCMFVTPITQERLDAILQAAKAPPPVPASSEVMIEKAIVSRVLFQVRYGNHEPIRRKVTRLHVNGCWPLTGGQAMKVWVGAGPMDETAADVRVNGCYKQDRSWFIDCFFLGAPPALLLEKLQNGNTMQSSI